MINHYHMILHYFELNLDGGGWEPKLVTSPSKHHVALKIRSQVPRGVNSEIWKTDVRTFVPEPSTSSARWNITWLDVACTYGISLVRGFPTASSRRFGELGVQIWWLGHNWGRSLYSFKHMSIGSLIPTISTYSKDLSPDKDNQACINLSASLAPHT